MRRGGSVGVAKVNLMASFEFAGREFLKGNALLRNQHTSNLRIILALSGSSNVNSARAIGA